MNPNSDTTDALAVTAQPDWSRQPKVTFAHSTVIVLAVSGKEQRERIRQTPKARLSYVVSGLTLAEMRAGLLRAEAEGRAPCIVPFWTEGTITVTGIVANQVTIGVDPRRDFFVAGQYVFLDDLAGHTGFRLVTAVTDRGLTLAADGTAYAFGANAKIYPCRKCRRIGNDELLSRDDLHSHTLRYEYETIA